MDGEHLDRIEGGHEGEHHEGENEEVARWLEGLKAGDDEAIGRIWERYSPRVLAWAAARLRRMPRGIEDEDDLACKVFAGLCDGARRGLFPQLGTEPELVTILRRLLDFRIVDLQRRSCRTRRGGPELTQRARQTSQPALERIADRAPGAVAMLQAADDEGRLLSRLKSARQRQIAAWRIAGHTTAEIAELLGVSLRSVESSLQQIRIACIEL